MTKKKKKEISVTLFFFHKSGIVTVANTLFPAGTSKQKIIKRIVEILDLGGSPTAFFDFRTTYTDISDVINVMLFTPTEAGQFSYDRG